MANRLFSDIQDSSGRRYYFDLDSTPGIVLPGVGAVSIAGYPVFYPDAVFRTPATVVLTLNGNTVGPDVRLQPATAVLTPNNSTVGLQTERTILVELASPVESPENEFVPTLVTIMLVAPDRAQIVLATTNHSLSQGGNIGFLAPVNAALTLTGHQYIRNIPPAEGQASSITLAGLEPTLATQLVCEPAAAMISTVVRLPSIDKGFIWIDDDPSPAIVWS